MWPMKILRFTVLVQVLLLLAISSGCVNGATQSHKRTTRQFMPLAQGTFNNILQSMSEGAKAVRLVVSRPFQQLRNSIPRFLPGGSSTTPRPAQNRPQKQTLDLSEVHYHYDDFGNRIENPKEYLKQFKNSISHSHSHSHIGDASTLPENVIKQLELKEEQKFEKDVDSGTAFSFSEYGKTPSFSEFSKPSFKSNFHNSHFDSFGGFESSSLTHHNDDWAPVPKAKPASSLHTSVGGGSDNLFGQSKQFLSNRKQINNYRNVKHYDSDLPSRTYSFHHFASPSVDFGVDTKEKEGSSYSSLLGSSSNKVSKTQNFDHFYDHYDHKFKDYHGSESQILAVAEQAAMEQFERTPEAAPLVMKAPTTTTTQKPTTTQKSTTTQKPTTTTTRVRPTTTRGAPRVPAKHHQEREPKPSSNTERPNYPEYFFSKPKAEPQKPKFIPMRNVRDEEDLFKGNLMIPPKFISQAVKYPPQQQQQAQTQQQKEAVHIVMAQPVHDKDSLKAKEKFRKQMEGDKKTAGPYSQRKRYPTLSPRPVPTKAHAIQTTIVPSPVPTVVNTPVASFTEGYAQNEVTAAVESERKYPKKYQTVPIETTTAKIRARPTYEAKPTSSSSYNRGAVRARGSVKFGARL